MTSTSVSSDYAPSDADRASDVILRFEDLQRASSSTASWDDDEDDISEADSCGPHDDQATFVSLRYLWDLVSSSLAFSVVTGLLWNFDFVAMLSLPLQLSHYCNAWPPALSSLASLTILAIVLQPEGYTWVLLRKAGDCILTTLQESSTLWSILINNFGTVISTFLAASVFFGLFFFIYVLHKALSPRPKLHLQYHDHKNPSDHHKSAKKRRKKTHSKTGSKVNNRLQPRLSKDASEQCQANADARTSLERSQTSSPIPRASLADTLATLITEERRVSHEMLPALLEDSPVNAPLESPFLSSANPTSSRLVDKSQSAKPTPLKSPAEAIMGSTTPPALRSRTLSASSEATTASCSDSSMSSRSEITVPEIHAPPGFERKISNRATTRRNVVGDSVSISDVKALNASRSSARTTSSVSIPAATPNRSSKKTSTPARRNNSTATHVKVTPTRSSVPGSGQGKPVPAPPGLEVFASTPANKSLPAPSQGSSLGTLLPLNRSRSVGDPVTTSPALPPIISTSTTTAAPFQTPARSSYSLNASASPFSTPAPRDSSYLASAQPFGASSLNPRSPVWDATVGIATPSPNRLSIPPPPGIPVDTMPTDNLMLPTFGCSSKDTLPASWSYGGLVDANMESAGRPFEVPRSALYMNHHHVVCDNPFANSSNGENNDEDDEQIEAELQELGGRMIENLLDF